MEIPFSPEYPNIRKTIDSDKWILYIKSKCIVNCEAFLHVMNQWVKEPENVTPPILRAEIIKEETNEIKENDYTIIKQIRRKIVSRQERDKNIIQDVKFIKYDNGECKAIHTPVFNDEIKSYSDFPYYFPPLKKFSYGIIPITNNDNKNEKNQDKEVSNNSEEKSEKKIEDIKENTEDKDDTKINIGNQDKKDDSSLETTNNKSEEKKNEPKNKKSIINTKKEPLNDSKDLAYIYLEIIPIEDNEEISERMKKIYTRLLKMLFKHCRGTMNGYKKRVIHDVLVPKIIYQDTYREMKKKYGKYWVENWPEDTDPQKHVFEDIGIATWLKLLWNNDKEKTSFIDIGCGNGLLTNLLTKEGFKGYGIDISKRKVWDLYEKDVKLEERFISPLTETFDNDTWLIGNHPDEMTLWIPIMAARSGYKSKFVIIPCCPFELSGAKFTGEGFNLKNVGRYRCFLERARQLIRECGYVVEEENLRIPSTKNIALIGRKRSFKEDDEETHTQIKKKIERYIKDVESSGDFKLRIPDDEKQRQLLAKKLARKSHQSK
ncbi:DUF1613-domain-containing protein [Piromyces finnis]|uniref:tRNA (uracil-O(2)-)-methyltransferase n=1 Tax=Piromyces finnis TaxID=1754191 RepID=A0A1Y1V0X8_9FUNG|nr:DUF1613-domain-containing protein [Piromyces finnis]|eukprot:ORX44298.1 DUF1613-domain-containing protein [Piromyces finnis]